MFPLTEKTMTKTELLGHNEDGKKLSSLEIFEISVSSLRGSINRCVTGVRCSIWQSSILSYHQRRKLEQFCNFAEQILHEMSNWQYFQKKSDETLELFK